MQPRTETRIADWEPRSADDGYAGLRALAESGFSGAISASGATLFMLDGRAIGLADGAIDSFEAAPLTARSAPHPALPLLFAMWERGGETRATYYTNDTPIGSTRETLESGGFTGYVELSENVLSGDYFVVYHRGRSMSVGFVGSTDRLITDEEAESRLDDEVGIYTVEAVSITQIEIPEPTADAGGSTAPVETPPTAETADTTDADPTETDAAETGEVTAGEPETTPAPETRSIEDDTAAIESAHDPRSAEHGEPSAAAEPPEPTVSADTDRASADAEPAPATGAPDEPPASASDRAAEPTDPRDRWGSVIDDPVEDRLAAERQWRETARIPSLDPERSALSTGGPASAAAETTPEPSEDVLSRALDALESEREAREAAERTVTELRETVERLEERLAAEERTPSSESDPGPEPASGRSLDPETALSGTNLFVRYASKGAATLEDAHAGETDREALEENLRLERRTEFDSTDATVAGEPFEAFLTDRLEHRFAEWLVGDLPFELAETGHANSLGALYDALPAIDRIEFHGAIEAEEGTRSFDVICRNRMGEALFVVDCAETRAATTDERVAALVEGATDTKAVAPDLAGAMIVTTSYFDPGALSTAEEATRSGLLGGSRESYVTISRRTGYHLCLVEMHDGTFHVTVPEL